MSGEKQSHAPGSQGGPVLDHLDFVTLLNGLRDVHMRETSALQAEIARLDSQIQQASTAMTEAKSSEAGLQAGAGAGDTDKSIKYNSGVEHERKQNETGATKNCQATTETGAVSKSVSWGPGVILQGDSSVQSADVSSSGIKREPQRESEATRRDSLTNYIRESYRNVQISDLFKHGQDLNTPQTRIGRLVMSTPFDTFMTVIIVINVLVIALETEYRGLGIASELKDYGGNVHPRSEWEGAGDVFDALEWVFGLIFWAELILRAYGLRMKIWKSFIVWIDILVAVSWTVGKAGGSTGNINPTVVRVVRVLRVMRLVKLARSLEVFDSLHMINTAFVSSMTALMWFSVVLTAVLTFCALCVTAFLHEYYFQNPDTANRSTEENVWEMYLSFGTFTRSLFSMFELALANWPPLSRLLSEEVTQWFMLLTVGHKLVIGFALVGVINGIFMQETFTCVALDDAIMVRQKIRQDKGFGQKMHRLFMLADQDGSGALSFNEFRAILEYKEVKTWLCALGFDSHDVEACFWMLAGEDGKITEEELIEGVQHLRGVARSIDVVTILTRGSVGNNAIKALHEVRAIKPKKGGQATAALGVASDKTGFSSSTTSYDYGGSGLEQSSQLQPATSKGMSESVLV